MLRRSEEAPAAGRPPPAARRPALWSFLAVNTGWFLILAYAFVLILGLMLQFRRSSLRAHRPSLFFVWFNVAWIFIAANPVEVGENDRFRFVPTRWSSRFLSPSRSTGCGGAAARRGQ